MGWNRRLITFHGWQIQSAGVERMSLVLPEFPVGIFPHLRQFSSGHALWKLWKLLKNN
jgi:hypothetical protein